MTVMNLSGGWELIPQSSK